MRIFFVKALNNMTPDLRNDLNTDGAEECTPSGPVRTYDTIMSGAVGCELIVFWIYY